MNYIFYFLLTLFATGVGSLTGMGGGVIIKPLMDFAGDYDIKTIGIIASIVVFSMALISIGKQIKEKTKIPFNTAIPLAVGSVFGGVSGEYILNVILDFFKADSVVTVVQNIVLSILILGVFVFMKNKNKIKCREIRSIPLSFLAGVFLGVCSSFLGIGGGPINVALIIYLFSYSTKTATVCSLITILFAQISKLSTVAITTGFKEIDLSVVALMVVAAILGGFFGAYFNKRFSEKNVEKAFNIIQLLVLGLTIFNVVRNLILLTATG